MLMLALLVQEAIPASAFGWNDYPVPRLAKPAVVPGGATGATPKIWIPLPQYLHPFAGKLVLKQKNWDGASISSFRYSPKDNRCEITITRIGSGGIGPQAWMCAYISEIAACNGSPGHQWRPAQARRHLAVAWRPVGLHWAAVQSDGHTAPLQAGRRLLIIRGFPASG